jgi:hypothetical protein
LKHTELCLLTTENRLIVNGNEAENWVLPSTTSRFSHVGSLLDENSAVCVRGKGSAQKLVKFLQQSGSSSISVEVTLSHMSDVFGLVPLLNYQALAVIYIDGVCELRSFSTLELCCNKLDVRSKGKLSRGNGKNKPTQTETSDLLCCRYFANKSSIIQLFANGEIILIRVIAKATDDTNLFLFSLEKETSVMPIPSVSNDKGVEEFTSGVISANISNNTFYVSTLKQGKEDEGDKCRMSSFAVSIDTLRCEPLVVNKTIRLFKAIDSGSGCRLLGFNPDLNQVEAWDIVHGVLLETWASSSDINFPKGCDFLKISPSGRSVALGDSKNIQILTINLEKNNSESSSLARALLAITENQPDYESANHNSKIMTSKKRKNSRNGEHEIKKSRISLDFAASAFANAFQMNEFDTLIESLDSSAQQQLCTLRVPGIESPLVHALEQGRLDFVLKSLDKSSDIPPRNIVQLIRFCLNMVASSGEPDEPVRKGKSKNKSDSKGENGSRKQSALAIKALEECGRQASKSEGELSPLESGVAHLLARLLTSPNVVEMELLEAISEELNRPEELIALLSSLLYVAETAESHEKFQQVLFASVFALDAHTLVTSSKQIFKGSTLFGRFGRVLSREITFCEKSEHLLQKIQLLLTHASEGKSGNNFLEQSNIGEYRTETVVL